jgi:hypothetical protein
MVRAKLRVAGDNYVAQAVKPLGKTSKELKALGAKAGFNWVEVPPTMAPGLQGTYFPRETAERLVAALKPEGKGLAERSVKPINEVLTPLRASSDISWFMQQGSAMLFRHPLRGTAGASEVIRSATGDPARYRQLLDGALAEGAAHLGMGTDEYAKFLISKGFALTADDLGHDVIAFKGVTGGTNAPGLKQVRQGYQAVARFSNETYARYLNYAGVTLANDAVELAVKTGAMDQLDGALAAVNRMVGRTGRQPSNLESIFEFAPRFFSSAVEQTFAAVSKRNLEGAIARRHIGRMLVTGALLVTLANKVRGYDTEFSPRSPNFLRLRNVGGLDISLFGTYDTLFRAIAGTIAGPAGESPAPDIMRLWKLAEGKMSPALSLVYNVSKGETYTGEPLDFLGSPVKSTYEVATSMAPFSVQSMIKEGIQPAIETGDPRHLLTGLASEAASSTGLTNTPVTPTEQRDWARDSTAQSRFGKDYADLEGAQKAQVNEDKNVSRWQTEADRNTLTREGDRSRYTKIQIDVASQLDALSKELEGGQISGNDWRDQYHSLQDQLRGARVALEQGDQSGLIGGWFGLYDQATLPDGRIDYTKLDQLQADYTAKHPTVEDELLKSIGVHDNPTVRRYRQAQKEAQAYYALPAYRGFTLEQSQTASRYLQVANSMASFGQARTVRQALYMMGQNGAPAEDIILARRAMSRGSNPARKAFRRAHPLFAEFYSDITG